MGVKTPLLDGLTQSDDPATKVAGSSITAAGDVLQPEAVARITLDAVRAETFLVLPHPQVLDMYRQKGADYDRWIAGMRRYQGVLEEQVKSS
jgi:hypothetical protein